MTPLRAANPAQVAAAYRTGGAAGLPFPSFALLPVAAAVYEPEGCPLCAAGVPVVKPGSRPEKAF